MELIWVSIWRTMLTGTFIYALNMIIDQNAVDWHQWRWSLLLFFCFEPYFFFFYINQGFKPQPLSMGKFTILPALTIYFASSIIMILFAEQVCLCQKNSNKYHIYMFKGWTRIFFSKQYLYFIQHVNDMLENLDLNKITRHDQGIFTDFVVIF